MKLQLLLRQIHRWGSIAIALPIGVAIGAGLLLMLKKEIAWIQPPAVIGAAPGATPAASIEAMVAAATADPRLEADDWSDFARIEARPKEGVFKFVARNGWEAQVDASNAAVLQVAYRRSDLIESIHDGSFFAGWTKHFLFFPAGIVLFGLWATGLYLFFLPYFKRGSRKRRRAGAAAPAIVDAGSPMASDTAPPPS